MIRTPKEAFLKSAHAEAWAAVEQTEAFQTACEYALIVLLGEMPPAVDPSKGWDSFSKMDGARRVLDILKTLSLKDEIPKREPRPTPYR